MATKSYSHTSNLYLSLTRPGIIDKQTIEGSTLTTGTLLEESGLTSDQKKIKLVKVNISARWHEKDTYEVHKVQKGIRNHIFKYVRFCKSKGARIAYNNLEHRAIYFQTR